ncbi:hypothetical protein J3Q64DRAFT_1850079 [Phycomyces blakesleeanus]|uniref:Uncharacterized protein n=2 Tax=Phycomyces blakesleeanus TaxID=4837 RepID=A0A167PLS3_PHYB8|nr:hypothetical protein PHYBLDRAFT_140281 [Phycomyces blakesleeanus NRRL 1555(-)]OAD78179.1 hypothetical protein PHYBLDRAFT_140281 [Phycomyces blakesleeanus NRRL 1555(-)]|eukprot:XP_018296219.1 hypothetical protein PHYBLDRAFT_140281 [Phycomyces blakesleeanus NRRL 1555(-)]
MSISKFNPGPGSPLASYFEYMNGWSGPSTSVPMTKIVPGPSQLSPAAYDGGGMSILKMILGVVFINTLLAAVSSA